MFTAYDTTMSPAAMGPGLGASPAPVDLNPARFLSGVGYLTGLASSSETYVGMMKSSPGFQFTGAITACLALN